MQVFEPLQAWQERVEKDNAAMARLLKWSESKFSRAKRGLTTLSMRDQLALKELTGIEPVEWTAFYASLAKARDDDATGTVKKKPNASAAREVA